MSAPKDTCEHCGGLLDRERDNDGEHAYRGECVKHLKSQLATAEDTGYVRGVADSAGLCAKYGLLCKGAITPPSATAEPTKSQAKRLAVQRAEGHNPTSAAPPTAPPSTEDGRFERLEDIEVIEERVGWALFTGADGEVPHFVGFFLDEERAETMSKALRPDDNSDHDWVPACIAEDGRILAANTFEPKEVAERMATEARLSPLDTERLRAVCGKRF